MPKKSKFDLTDARKAAGLTIEGLARKVGVHSRTVVRWERSGRMPRCEAVLKALMSALGVA